jgi:hypothetical protein
MLLRRSRERTIDESTDIVFVHWLLTTDERVVTVFRSREKWMPASNKLAAVTSVALDASNLTSHKSSPIDLPQLRKSFGPLACDDA